MTDAKFMRMAFGEARRGIKNGQSPFAACIVKNGRVASCAHNAVWRKMDITAHAEMEAIREACCALSAIDLAGCVMYATCQPCPMCFVACQRAGIGEIVYSVRSEDARRIGFGKRATREERRQPYPFSSTVEVVPDFLREEGLKVLEEWRKHGDGRTY